MALTRWRRTGGLEAACQQPALLQATVQVMSENMFLIWPPVVISTTITTTDTMTRMRAYSTIPWPDWALRNRFTDRAAYGCTAAVSPGTEDAIVHKPTPVPAALVVLGRKIL